MSNSDDCSRTTRANSYQLRLSKKEREGERKALADCAMLLTELETTNINMPPKSDLAQIMEGIKSLGEKVDNIASKMTNVEAKVGAVETSLGELKEEMSMHRDNTTELAAQLDLTREHVKQCMTSNTDLRQSLTQDEKLERMELKSLVWLAQSKGSEARMVTT